MTRILGFSSRNGALDRSYTLLRQQRSLPVVVNILLLDLLLEHPVVVNTLPVVVNTLLLDLLKVNTLLLDLR